MCLDGTWERVCEPCQRMISVTIWDRSLISFIRKSLGLLIALDGAAVKAVSWLVKKSSLQSTTKCVTITLSASSRHFVLTGLSHKLNLRHYFIGHWRCRLQLAFWSCVPDGFWGSDTANTCKPHHSTAVITQALSYLIVQLPLPCQCHLLPKCNGTGTKSDSPLLCTAVARKAEEWLAGSVKATRTTAICRFFSFSLTFRRRLSLLLLLPGG